MEPDPSSGPSMFALAIVAIIAIAAVAFVAISLLNPSGGEGGGGNSIPTILPSLIPVPEATQPAGAVSQDWIIAWPSSPTAL